MDDLVRSLTRPPHRPAARARRVSVRAIAEAADPSPNPAHRRSYTWHDPGAIAAAGRELSGLELMRAARDGRLPAPPMIDLIAARLTEVERGRITFALTPAEWMYNPIGAVHGGIAATLLDSCMGCAVQTLLDAGVAYTTTDLQVRYVRAMTAETGRVLAIGEVVHPGRRMVTVEARLVTEQGERLIAHGSSACIVLG